VVRNNPVRGREDEVPARVPQVVPLRSDAAMAPEINEVDNSMMMLGGVTTANFPQAARNFERSATEAASVSSLGLLK